MKKLYLSLAICSTLPLCAATAFGAATGAGSNYVSANVSAVFLSDADLNIAGVGGFEAEYSTGWGLDAAFGHDFGMVRAEVELAYRTNDIDDIKAGGVAVATTGDATTWALMLNGYYDFKNSSPVTPYLMAGLGYARVEANSVAMLGVPILDDDDNVFAYQVGAGVGWKVSDEITLDLSYRYFATSDPGFTAVDGITPIDAEYGSHNIMLGLRVCF